MNEHRHYQYIRNVRQLSDSDRAAISQLNQYQNIVLFPLGKKIEMNTKLFFEYFDSHKKDIFTFNVAKNWRGIQAISGPHVTSPIYKWNQEFLSLFPDLMEQVKDVFPFLDIHTFHFWEQAREIPAHQDGGAADLSYLFPWSYRFIILEQDEPTFYVQKLLTANQLPYTNGKERLWPKVSEEKEFLRLPKDSNTFCFNNSGCLHGSLLPKGRKVVGFFDAEIDFTRHLNIIKNSVENHFDYLVKKLNYDN